MEKVLIAFFDAKPYDIEFFDKENKKYNYHIDYIEEHLNLKTLDLVNNHNVVCAFVNDNISYEIINSLKQKGVKLIALRSSGYNNIDLKASYNNINVVRVPEYSPYAVAEHTVTLILALNRKITNAVERTKKHNFSLNGLLGVDLNGKTVGVIGTGKIGKLVIKILLKGFNMKVLAYDTYPDNNYAQNMGFQYVDIDTIYRNSDIITLNCPLTKETLYMINEESISKFKDGVMVINTGRGKLIDTKALIKGIKSKKISCAGLDVYEEESEYFFEDFSNSILDDDDLAILLSFNNVIITSHQGFFTVEALKKISEITLKNIDDFFNGKALENEICYKCDKNICRKNDSGRCFR